MKRYIAIFVVIIICFSVMLSACNTPPDDYIEGSNTESESSPNGGFDILGPTTILPPTFRFESYNELKDALVGTDETLSEYIRKEESKYGEIYQSTLDAFENGSLSVLVPCITGSPMQIRDWDDYAKVTLMAYELYYLPWIWYHVTYDIYNMYIKMSYVSVANDPDIDAAETYLDILSVIAPNAPAPDNYHQHPGYKNIYEKEIKLRDRTVTALVYELNDDSRISVRFHIDGVLVDITGEEKALSDSFFSKFSLKAI